MICGVVTQSAALCYMTWKTNWDDEVKLCNTIVLTTYICYDEELVIYIRSATSLQVFKAQQRLKRFYMKSSEVTHQNPELV